MKTTKQIGDAGETLAVEELEKTGYRIVERNFRTRFGEIDIVAKEGGTLVFVEVKAKGSDYFGSAAEMITKRKLDKIKRTAQDYLIKNNLNAAWRIDAVVIDSGELEIIKNITL